MHEQWQELLDRFGWPGLVGLGVVAFAGLLFLTRAYTLIRWNKRLAYERRRWVVVFQICLALLVGTAAGVFADRWMEMREAVSEEDPDPAPPLPAPATPAEVASRTEVPVAPVQPDWPPELRVAHKAAKAGDWVKAAEILMEKSGADARLDLAVSRIVRYFPQFRAAYKTLGQRYAKASSFEQAEAAYKRAVALDENDPEARLLFAKFELQRNRQRAALIHLDDAVRLSKPGDARANALRAPLLVEVFKDYATAASDYGRLIEAEPDEAEHRVRRAELLADHLAMPEEALVDLNVAVKLRSEDPRVRALRSRLLVRLERFQAAVEDLAICMRLEPDNITHIVALGDAYLKVGEAPESPNRSQTIQKAVEAFAVVLNKDPGNEAALLGRARAYGARGDHKQAIDDLTVILDRNAQNAAAFRERGYLRMRSGTTPLHFDRAVKDLSSAISIDRSDGWAYLYRGDAHLRLGDRRKAESDWLQAQSIAEKGSALEAASRKRRGG